MKLAIAAMTVKADVSEAVRKRAEMLTKELAQYQKHAGETAPSREHRKKSRER